jgi:hypothetical protein
MVVIAAIIKSFFIICPPFVFSSFVELKDNESFTIKKFQPVVKFSTNII